MNIFLTSKSFLNQSKKITLSSSLLLNTFSTYSHRPSNEIANLYKRNDRITSSHDYLFGINPIQAAFSAKRRKFKGLYIQDTFQNIEKMSKEKQNILKIIKKAEELNVKIEYQDKHNLNLLSKNRPHQGVVLKATPLDFIPLKTIHKPLKDNKELYLVLDEVSDPQNLGAILRSCYFLGVDGIIVCSKNSAPLNEIVSKTSSGALELVKIYSSSNLMRLIDDAKENDWMVYGTGLSLTPIKPIKKSQENKEENEVHIDENENQSPQFKDIETIDLTSATFDKSTLLILGSEGEGIRTNILRRCDKLIKISKHFNKNLVFDENFDEKNGDSVDSLNVSVSCGIILNHFLNLKNK